MIVSVNAHDPLVDEPAVEAGARPSSVPMTRYSATAPNPTRTDVRAPYRTRAQMSRAETSVPRMCGALGGWRAPSSKSIQFGWPGRQDRREDRHQDDDRAR